MIKVLLKVVLVGLCCMIISEFQQCIEEHRKLEEIVDKD